MPRSIKIERDKPDQADGDATIVVTEPQETRYTLAQAQAEQAMADAEVISATARAVAAKAKVQEARQAVKAERP